MDRFYMTETGLNYLAQTAAGKRLVFTKGEFGDGEAVSSVTTLTHLVHRLGDMAISKITSNGSQVSVTTQFSNKVEGRILEPFYLKEIGLYAKVQNADGTDNAAFPETLAAYAYASGTDKGDRIPGTLTEFIINWPCTVSNSENVSVEVSSLAYAKEIDFENHKNSAVLDHPDKSVTSEKIADGAVINDKLAHRTIERSKICMKAVGTDEIDDKVIVTRHIGDKQINALQLNDNCIANHHLIDGSVTVGKIADGSITKAKLASEVKNELHTHSNKTALDKILDDTDEGGILLEEPLRVTGTSYLDDVDCTEVFVEKQIQLAEVVITKSSVTDWNSASEFEKLVSPATLTLRSSSDPDYKSLAGFQVRYMKFTTDGSTSTRLQESDVKKIGTVTIQEKAGEPNDFPVGTFYFDTKNKACYLRTSSGAIKFGNVTFEEYAELL